MSLSKKSCDPWAVIHSTLADLFKEMKIYKTSKDSINLSYSGTGKQLKKKCLRILNALESLDQELGYGISTEDRWS